MAARSWLPLLRVGPSGQPRAPTRVLLRLWVSAGDLAAPRPRKGNRAEEGVLPSSRKDRTEGVNTAIETVSFFLRVGKQTRARWGLPKVSGRH